MTADAMITANDIIRIAPASRQYAVELVKQMREAGIMANVKRASMFLASVHIETGGFTAKTESLNYAADALIRQFGRHRISEADAKKFGRIDAAVRERVLKEHFKKNPRKAGQSDSSVLSAIGWNLPDQDAHQNALANILYGGEWGAKNLGNTKPGDGWKFRGRGGKQTTGRSNYRSFSRAWLGDESLLENPERVAEPDGWVASAIYFWKSKGLNEVADRQGMDAVTRIINGGLTAISDRKSWMLKYAGAWRVG